MAPSFPDTPAAVPADALADALFRLGRWLQQSGYHFTTVTPSTQARVNARPDATLARNLADVFGWSRPFNADLLPREAVGWLQNAGLLEAFSGTLRSRVRFSSLYGQLYAHSAWPTDGADAVFFGPDTCRFAALVRAELARQPLAANSRILDIGCGAGPGGLVAALGSMGHQPALLLADINPTALEFARANARLAGVPQVQCIHSDLYAALDGSFNLIVANPPYLLDASERLYRHGGGPLGSALSLRILQEGLSRLAAGGRLVLYTGAPIVGGHDPLLAAALPIAAQAGAALHYRELDPDVFGEELDQPAYAQVERIAAVALVASRPHASAVP